MLDKATLNAVADCLDAESQARLAEADDARNKTGTFSHLGDLPTVDDEIDLPGIILANAVVANAFAELAQKVRALA